MSDIHVHSVPKHLAARGARHVNFDLIAKMNLGELTLEPLRPELNESTQFDWIL